MKRHGLRHAPVWCLALVLTACAIEQGGSPPADRSPGPASGGQPAPTVGQLSPQQADRLKAVMLPLLAKMDRPIPHEQVTIGVMEDPNINAANAGGGRFFVTTGLLQRANDTQLTGVMAHEVAHADLGHVTKLTALNTGVNVATVLLDAIGVKGAGTVVPIAGALLVER